MRVKKAYPVYDADYQDSVAVLREFLGGFENLQTVGRNGQHRYNNQDHSMVTGIYAARNIAGAAYDVWEVNVEKEYHEEVKAEPALADRLTPSKVVEASLEELLRKAFARYDPTALGVAVGTVLAAGLFFATLVLLLSGEPYGPNLSLIGNYFLGYNVSWGGMLVGTLEAALGGFALGWIIARAINLLVGAYETSLRRRLQLSDTLDPLVTDG